MGRTIQKSQCRIDYMIGEINKIPMKGKEQYSPRLSNSSSHFFDSIDWVFPAFEVSRLRAVFAAASNAGL